MAPQRTWLTRAEEIIEVLRRMKSRQLDRPAIENLYQLQRRAANVLMTQAGATGDPRTGYIIDRTSLLSWTQKIWDAESVELARQQATSEELSRSLAEVHALRKQMAEEGRTPLKFPVNEEFFRARIDTLPPAITIENGRIVIDVDQLPVEERLITTCQLLYELAMALNNDPINFEARLLK